VIEQIEVLQQEMYYVSACIDNNAIEEQIYAISGACQWLPVSMLWGYACKM